MTKELINKIIRSGGIYDTKAYRYNIDTSTGNILRAPIKDIGTAAMLAPDAWTVVGHI